METKERLSVKMVVNVCRCLLVKGSQNDSFPLSQSSSDLTSSSLTVMSLLGFSGDCKNYLPSLYETHQTLVSKETFPFLSTDPRVMPIIHNKLSPNLHIPEVCSWVKAPWSQDTGIWVKSLWIIRNQLPHLPVSQTGQIIRQNQTFYLFLTLVWGECLSWERTPKIK